MFTQNRRTAIFRAEFSSPLFQAFHQAWQLQQALYEVVAPHGVSPSDVGVERREGEPSCSANVLSLGAVVNVRLTHVEVFFLHLDDDDSARASLLSTLLTRLSELTGGYRLYSLAFDHHGALDGTTPQAFIRRWVTPPSEGLGPITDCSAAFYYGPSKSRDATSVHLEPSSIVPGGLFIKTSSVWRAEGNGIDTVLRDGMAASRDALALLGLAPAGS